MRNATKYESGETFNIRELSELEGISREDYEFLGWSTDKNATEPEYGGIYQPMTASFDADTTLYAIWTPIHCTIYFNACGGTFDSDQDSAIGDAPDGLKKVTIVKGSELGKVPSISYVVNKGQEDEMRHYLVGWFTESVGGTRVTTFTRFNEDTTLYAQWHADNTMYEWRPTQCKVFFNANGGSTTNQERWLEKGAKLGEVSAATKGGNEFLGWFSKQEWGKGWEYTAESVIGKDMTLYARWSGDKPEKSNKTDDGKGEAGK